MDLRVIAQGGAVAKDPVTREEVVKTRSEAGRTGGQETCPF